MQLTEDFLKRWEEIVDQVDKDHIPIECIKKVVFRISGGRQKTINLQRLKQQGLDMDEVQEAVDTFVQANSDLITNMEFVLDIAAVAELLQPETDKLLKAI
jgi:Asp-tRNA(Asn)/Glu-tRNA(Gln) amidotransferase B subunit